VKVSGLAHDGWISPGIPRTAGDKANLSAPALKNGRRKTGLLGRSENEQFLPYAID